MSSPKSLTTLSLLGLCAINLVVSIDATALAVATLAIAASVEATAIESYWFSTSFVLASAIFQPVFAAFSTAFGNKPVVMVALVLFAVGTIICSVAGTVIAMLVGRTIQGVGGGGLLTMTYVVIADLYSLRDRSKGLAIISMVWLLGTVCGPLLSGAFTRFVTWRWIFWIVLPFVGSSFVLVAAFLQSSHRTLSMKGLSQIDWVGAVLLIVASTSMLVGASWAGTLFSWKSWQTISTLVTGGVAFLMFVWYEARYATFPIIPLTVLGNSTTASAFLGTFVLGVVQFGLLYYLPLYYQVVKGFSPFEGGLALLPQCLLSGPTTAITGVVISKTGRYRVIIWLGWILLATGCGLLVLLDSSTTTAQWILINITSGVGLGALFTSQSVASQVATDAQHKAIVSGLTPFFRTVGQACGIIVCATIFQNTFHARLLEAPSDDLHI